MRYTRSTDQILLEQAYGQILNEAMLPNFPEVKEAMDSQIDQIAGENPQIADWLKKRISKLVSKGTDQEVNRIINLRDNRFTPQFREEITSIKDYLGSLDERNAYKALRGDFQSVANKSEEWHKQLAKPKKDQGGDASISAYFKDTKPFFNLKNGWKIVQLTSQEACKLEGGDMGHCVGGGSYTPQNILSLRDPKGRPHATIEIKRTGDKIEIHQIKGKQNRAPKDEYKEMVREMIRSNPEKFIVKADASNIGFVQWDDQGYDPNSEQWQNVLKTKVAPARDRIKQQILAQIQKG